LPLDRKPIPDRFRTNDMSRPENNRFKYALVKKKNGINWVPALCESWITPARTHSSGWKVPVTELHGAISLHCISLSKHPMAPRERPIIIYASLLGLFIIVFFRFWRKQFFKLNRKTSNGKCSDQGRSWCQKEELTSRTKALQTASIMPSGSDGHVASARMFKTIFTLLLCIVHANDLSVVIFTGLTSWITNILCCCGLHRTWCSGSFYVNYRLRIVQKRLHIEGLSRPSDILNRLNEDFIYIQNVSNVGSSRRHGCGLLLIDKDDRSLEFSGAFNPLYVIRDNKITEIKGWSVCHRARWNKL